MSGLYSQYATDQKKEVEGIEINYGKNSKGDDIVIRVARAGGRNSVYQKVAEQTFKPYRRQLDPKSPTIDPKDLEKLLIEIYAKAVVKGWSGVEDENGEPMPYTQENVIKLFTDLPDIFSDVQACAESMANFKVESLEAEAKN